MSTSRKDIGPDGHSTAKGVDPDGLTSRKAVEEDDVEGHSMLISPTLGRDLQKAKSQDIDRSLRSKQQETEAKRVFRR